MAYNKTVWVNNEEPSIDADNLNKMEQGIFDAQYPDGGTSGQLLAKTVNGKAWVDAPNSAVWGLIQGTLSDQTDLQAALDDVGNVDTVNGIQPDTNKNVQVDVELTQAQYDALPSSKLTDDVNYYIKDGTNLPVSNVIPATGVQYDNSSSGLSATNVQSAVNELKQMLSIKLLTIEPQTIPANDAVTVTNTTLKSRPIVGYRMFGVKNGNITITQIFSTSTEFTLVLKNNGSASFTTGNINIYYL